MVQDGYNYKQQFNDSGGREAQLTHGHSMFRITLNLVGFTHLQAGDDGSVVNASFHSRHVFGFSPAKQYQMNVSWSVLRHSVDF